MTIRRTKVCLYSALWRKDAVGVLLMAALVMWVAVSVLWVAVVNVASASEPSQVPVKSQYQGPDKLPRGMDPRHVLRMMQRDGGGFLEDRVGVAEPPESAPVSAAGVVLDTTGIAIPAGPSSGQWYPAIASGPVCASLVAYTDYPSTLESWPPSGWFNHGRIYGNIWKAARGTAFVTASGTAHSGYVSLEWQMTADVSEYSFVIQHSESPEGTFTTIDPPISRGADFSFSCRDYGVSSGKAYWYKIVLASSFCEQFPISIEVEIEPLPAAYRVSQSYPNPFNPLCTIEYEITWAGKVSLRVFDLSGSSVCTLVDAWRGPVCTARFGMVAMILASGWRPASTSTA